PHPPGVDGQADDAVHGAVPRVVELPLLDRAGDGPADRVSFEDLEVGDLVGTADRVASATDPLGVARAPGEPPVASPEAVVEPPRPPVAGVLSAPAAP